MRGRSIHIQQIGSDQYTVTDVTDGGRQAKMAALKTFAWDELCRHISANTPFPSRIFPSLKKQLESGQLVPLNFPEDEDADPSQDKEAS